MDAFDPEMFEDDIVLKAKVRPTPVGKRGGEQPSWSEPGVASKAYVEVVVIYVERPDTQQAQAKSLRRYRVFAPADTGAAIDDHAIWEGRTLTVKEPSVIQRPLWMFEAVDTE